jgi:hypothetical protein
MSAVQTAKREIAVGVMNLLVAEKAQIDYLEHRPMRTAAIDSVDALVKALTGRVEMDCSESVTLICHIGGLKDPSGAAFDGYGDTETMLKHLPHFADPKSANACTLVVFNADRPLAEQHVAIVHTADHLGGNPILFTHGHQGDPRLTLLRDLQAGFAGRTVFLSVASL